jgi:hypothetical protein
MLSRPLLALGLLLLAARPAPAQPGEPACEPGTTCPISGQDAPAPAPAQQADPACEPGTTCPISGQTTATTEQSSQLAALAERLAAQEARIGELERREAGAVARTAEGDPETGFRFGSYGRVIAGTDMRGGRPEPVTVVAHGPRIVEKTYLELDFAYGLRATNGALLRAVVTLAFGDRLFHETGEFDAQPALRNFFAEAAFDDGTRIWVGSRMYRGDDIYLFDYWPLDDQNTLGVGASSRKGAVEVAAHAGVNRLLDGFQFQERDVADPELGATTITQLDRQRLIGSASATYFLAAAPEEVNAKIKVHGELQGLPSGTRLRAGDETPEELPSDWGTTLGAQLGVWGMAPADAGYRRHANLFARWSKGLAAFDELAPPSGFDTELKVFPRASELVVGLGANWDDRWGHVLFGGYARRFVDADPNERDLDDGWEYAVDVRPMAHLYEGLFAGVDVSYQARFPRGLMPSTQLAADPSVVSVAPMLALSPMGPSGYDRPQLRLVYRVARQNDGARALYAEDDPRRTRSVMHFLGVQAEWWFNSTSYR